MLRYSTVVGLLTLVGCSEQGFSGKEPVDLASHAIPVPPEHVTDTMTQTLPTEADVLFVISNWWSMEQAYTELVESFGDMLDVFVGSGVDYHIGVISTDVEHPWEHGKLHEAQGVRWVDANNPDPVDTFAAMAMMDASGCAGPRRPRDATFLAFEYETDDNDGFRRADASLHTVFVSDDKDVSTILSFDEFVDWYNNYTQTPEIDTLSTIVDYSKDAKNLEATTLIGGSSHPIQDRPWANVLENIGLRAQGLHKEFFLSRVPMAETIEVHVVADGAELSFTQGTEEEGGDWSYEPARNSVYFHAYEPPEGSQIILDYDVLE